VQARIIDGVKFAVYIGDSQGLSVNLKFTDGAGWDFIFPRRTQKRHRLRPL
jgi:hypothetical protein